MKLSTPKFALLFVFIICMITTQVVAKHHHHDGDDCDDDDHNDWDNDDWEDEHHGDWDHDNDWDDSNDWNNNGQNWGNNGQGWASGSRQTGSAIITSSVWSGNGQSMYYPSGTQTGVATATWTQVMTATGRSTYLNGQPRTSAAAR